VPIDRSKTAAVPYSKKGTKWFYAAGALKQDAINKDNMPAALRMRVQNVQLLLGWKRR